MRAPPRRPGDRVIRRRLRPSRVLIAPAPRRRPAVPSVRTHARLFVLGLLAVVVAGTLLLASPWATRSGEPTPFVDALFTSVSALAVTGLVTVDTADHWNPLGQAVILALIQVGGLGFMVGASLVLRTLQRGTLGLRDALLVQDGAPTLSLREAAELSTRIVRFTFVVEGAGALLLTLSFAQDAPMGTALWHGVFHAVSAFCNAGFDLQGGYRSLTGYQSSVWVNVVVMALVQAGALSWLVFADMATAKRWSRLAVETRIVLSGSCLLVAVMAAVYLAAEWGHALAGTQTWAKPLAALFQSGAARTAGFTTVSFAEVTTITLFLFVAGMFVGGASGSTAGGVKLNTVGVAFTAVMATLRGHADPQIFGRRIPATLVFRALTVIALMFLAHFVATLTLTTVEHLAGDSPPFIALLFETMSALATVGLSTGITPELTPAGKAVVAATMFFGRIGPLTAVYALQRRQRPVRYRFPEAHVRIG